MRNRYETKLSGVGKGEFEMQTQMDGAKTGRKRAENAVGSGKDAFALFFSRLFRTKIILKKHKEKLLERPTETREGWMA